MFRLLALAAVAAGGLGSLVAAVGGPAMEFAGEDALEQRAAEFRARGPVGLHAALARYDELVADQNPDLEPAREQMRRCVDLAAGQRDAWMSRLFWYTDLDEAKAAAAASGKPILSLRMLGRLTDEFSCANSRFFRTALYPNETVGNRLRESFVLHWQSVRPVPRITIDFGDGRKLERTITGNSAHYVLDAAGRPLDVLPGLYGPQAFDAWLKSCEALAAEANAAESDQARAAIIAKYHADLLQTIDADLQTDLCDAALVNPREPLSATDLSDDQWQLVAALPRHRADLDVHSVALIRREHPTAADAGQRAFGKTKVEDPLVRVVNQFELSMALDAVKNEYLLHRQIHQWFAVGEAPRDFDALNERVYAELFLTPSSDPWLGLAPADAYTGLVGDGLSTADETPLQLGAAK